MKKEKRIYRPQGSVNHSFIQPDRSIYLKTLENQKTNEKVEGLFYRTRTEWIGYPKTVFHLIPCTHCGQTGIFHKKYWTHRCPAIHNNVELVCKLPHDCHGGPSFSWDWNSNIEPYKPGGWQGKIIWRDDEGWEEI